MVEFDHKSGIPHILPPLKALSSSPMTYPVQLSVLILSQKDLNYYYFLFISLFSLLI